MTDKTKLAAARDDIELIHFWLPDEYEPATPAYEALERIKAIVTQAIGEETEAPVFLLGDINTTEINLNGITYVRQGLAHPPAVDWIEGLRKPMLEGSVGAITIENDHRRTWNAALDAVKEGMK